MTSLTDQANALSQTAEQLSRQAAELAAQAVQAGPGGAEAMVSMPFFVVGLTVFVLACFVGYYVVWRVTPALHSPLMSVPNAVAGVIFVDRVIAAGLAGFSFSKVMGFVAAILASVNIFGGFIVT